MDRIEKDRKAICAVWRDLVDACGGNNRAAGLLKITPAQVSKYGFDHYNEMPRVDHAHVLEDDCGDPMMTRLMAELMGFTIVKQSKVIPADAFVQDISEMTSDTGRALSSIGAGMADGCFDAKDARSSLPAIRELIETATGIEHRLEQVSEGAEVVELRTKSA